MIPWRHLGSLALLITACSDPQFQSAPSDEVLPETTPRELGSPSVVPSDQPTAEAKADDCSPDDLRRFSCGGVEFQWAQLFLVPQPILTPDTPMIATVLEDRLHDWLLAIDQSDASLLPGAYEAIMAYDGLDEGSSVEIAFALSRDSEVVLQSSTRRFHAENAAWRWPLRLLAEGSYTLEMMVNNQVFRREIFTLRSPEGESTNPESEAVDSQ